MVNQKIYNWAHSVNLGDRNQVYKPQSEDELLDKMHCTQGGAIKVLGSGMSFNGIGRLDSSMPNKDLLLDLSELYSGEVEHGEDWATFGASTVLEDVSKSLIKRNKEITSCPGVLLTQTLAGALATGTHGQGMNTAGLYDSVLSIRVILADGTIKLIDRNDDDFGGFQIHLGALGILTHVKLECRPLTIFKVEKEITDFNSLCSNFLAWNNDHAHCKAWWFPGSDHVQLWRTVPANEKEILDYQNNESMLLTVGEKVHPKVKSLAEVKSSFKQSIEDLLQIMKKDTSRPSTPLDEQNDLNNSFDEARFRTVSRFETTESCIGNMYQIWCKGIPAPQVNCEIAVPLSSLSQTLTQLRDYYRSKKTKMHYPFILRATGKSTAWLSPAYTQSVCYIGFLVYLSPEDLLTDVSYDIAPGANQEKLEFLKSIEKQLCLLTPCIPHFGKYFTPELYGQWSSKFPRWNDFKELVKRMDPNGRFRNNFLNSILDSANSLKNSNDSPMACRKKQNSM